MHAGSPNDIHVRCPLVCELCGSQQALNGNSCSQPPSQPTSLMVDFVCQDCESYNEIDSSLPRVCEVCGWTPPRSLCQPSSCHDPSPCHDGIEGDQRIHTKRTNQELRCYTRIRNRKTSIACEEECEDELEAKSHGNSR